MARLRKLLTWFRGAASPKRNKKTARRHQAATPASNRRRHHETIRTASPARGRWVHKSVAQRYSVPEDVVRRIYKAVQTAKQQGLYGGYLADLVERSVGRKLVGNEYEVGWRAREHLGYDPPGGYQGPEPKGWAKEPPRPKASDVKSEAAVLVAGANATIKDVLARYMQWQYNGRGRWDENKTDRSLLRQAADELEVAADLYEEAGAVVRGGTLRERARHARQADFSLLAKYD